MATLGQKLKEAREAKKVSIERAHKDTRIHLKVLNAFESDNFDVLSPLYMKSFLKKYSEYLGLNGDGMINEYSSLYPQTPPVSLEPQASEPKAAPLDLKPFAIVAAFVAVIVLGVLVVRFAARMSKDLSAKPAAPKQVVVARRKAAPSFPVLPRGVPLKLAITAQENTWLQIRSDGKIIFQDVLAKATTKKIEAQKNIELWAGKAQALSLELNGHKLGSPGSGVVKGLVISRDGIRKK